MEQGQTESASKMEQGQTESASKMEQGQTESASKMEQGQTESASKMDLSSVDDQRCQDDANANTKRKAVNSGRQGSQRHIKESKSIIKTEITSGGDKCCQVIALKKLNSNINSNSLRKKYVDGSEKVVPRGQTYTRTDRRTRQSERCKKQRKLDDNANDASSDDQIQSDILNEKIAKHTTIVKTRVNGTECSKYRCNYCKKWTTNVALKGKMLAHLTKHEDGVLRCVHCGHDSVSVRALAEHVARVHTHKPQFVCALCGKACFCHKQLRQHEDIHNLHPRVCDHCGQTMHSLEQLKKHIKTEHGGDGLYSCDECRKTFIYQKWFDAHKVRQACGLKATCSVCGAEVVKGAGLSAHMRRVHAGEKRVPCSYCSYRAFTKTQVRLHERTHTRDYPFSCHLCAFSAAKKYQLTSHMRTHTGEKPFRCEQCPFASSWNIQLRTHQAAHTSATAVTCPVCSVVCKDARSLRMHKIREHAADRKLTEPMTAQAKPSAGGQIRRTRSSELNVTSTGPCPQDAHGREMTLEQTVARSGEVTSYIIVDETVAKDIERMGLETVSLVLLDGATVVPRNPASGDETASKHVPGQVDIEPAEVKDIERPSSDNTVEESELKCDTTATGTVECDLLKLADVITVSSTINRSSDVAASSTTGAPDTLVNQSN